MILAVIWETKCRRARAKVGRAVMNEPGGISDEHQVWYLR